MNRGEKVKRKLVDAIEMMDYEELIKVKKDIEGGGTLIREAVDEQIKREESKPLPECTVCSNNIIEDRESYTILFGKGSERKKASFCALDCLEYFLKELKQVEKKDVNLE